MCAPSWEPGGSRRAPGRTPASSAEAAYVAVKTTNGRNFVRQEGWVSLLIVGLVLFMLAAVALFIAKRSESQATPPQPTQGSTIARKSR